MRHLWWLLILVIASAAPARAQLPAVSEPNGKFALGAGAIGDDSQNSALGLAQGSFALPLGQSFGLQVDGAALVHMELEAP